MSNFSSLSEKFPLRNKSSDKLTHSPFSSQRPGTAFRPHIPSHNLLPKKTQTSTISNISKKYKKSKCNQVYLEGDLNFSNKDKSPQWTSELLKKINKNTSKSSEHHKSVSRLPRKSPVPIPRGWYNFSKTKYLNFIPKKSSILFSNNFPKYNGMNKTLQSSQGMKNSSKVAKSTRSLSPILRVKEQTPKMSPFIAKTKQASKSPNLSQSSMFSNLRKFTLLNSTNFLAKAKTKTSLSRPHSSSVNKVSNRKKSTSKESNKGDGNEKNNKDLVKSNSNVTNVNNASNGSNGSNVNINIIKVNCNNNTSQPQENIDTKKQQEKKEYNCHNSSNIQKNEKEKPIINSNIQNQSNNDTPIIINNKRVQTQKQNKPTGNTSNNPNSHRQPSSKSSKTRSLSTSAPKQITDFIASSKVIEVPKKGKYIKKKIREIYEFTHVGFDGEQDKANNQDSAFIERDFTGNPEYLYMSVCDGHGVEGHDVSRYIKNILPKDMSNNLRGYDLLTSIPSQKRNIYNKIIQTFLDANDKLVENKNVNSTFSGSTCVSVIYTPYKLICPNIGDSRAVIGKFTEATGKWTGHDLTRDHKPTEKDEAQRIKECGGRIEPFIDEDTGEFIGPQRVWLKEEDFPGLAMTRSFGDRVAATVGVISEPEITEYEFKEEDKFFLVASDGVWEFISSDECMNIIKDYYLNNDYKGCCEYLYLESKKRWIKEEEVVDDITMILVFLD